METKDTSVLFQVPSLNSEGNGRPGRLREALRKGGGNKVVSERSGVPLANLQTYLKGREMRIDTAIALAEACGVTLDWLATGKEPPSAPAPAAPTPALPPKLFSFVDMDQLGAAIDGAQAAFAAQGKVGKGRALAQVACLLYDDSKNRITETVETVPTAASARVTTN